MYMTDVETYRDIKILETRLNEIIDSEYMVTITTVLLELGITIQELAIIETYSSRHAKLIDIAMNILKERIESSMISGKIKHSTAAYLLDTYFENMTTKDKKAIALRNLELTRHMTATVVDTLSELHSDVINTILYADLSKEDILKLEHEYQLYYKNR